MRDRAGQYIEEYRLIRRLGAGAYGEVYLGEHVCDQSQVAVKVFQLAQEDLKFFIKEASTAFRLKHPHIVQLLSFGISSDDTPYLIMEYASHGTLRERHPRGTVLPVDIVLAYVRPLASALQYAHDRRVVHRDVKPENALLGSTDQVLLSDFGIAVVAPVERSLGTQNLGGTAPYMAPEQIRGKPQPASDQYALGIMAYEWLCGVRPFQGNQWEIFEQQYSSPPPSLREQRPDLPRQVEEVIFRALAKDPHERFVHVQTFATALESACREAPTLPTFASDSPTGPRPDRTPTGGHVVQELLAQPFPVSGPTYQSQDSVSTSAPGIGRPVEKVQPSRRRISRRAAVLALTGLAGVGIAGSAFAWLAVLMRPTVTPIVDPLPPLGTTLYTYHSKNGRYALAWSPNGQSLASASDVGTVQVWNATNGQVIFTYQHPAAEAIESIGWSPDGKLIAFNGLGDAVIDIWDATNGHHVLTSPGHYGGFALAWSPGSELIASGGSTVNVWKASTGEQVYTYPGIAGAGNLTSLAWSPDGKRIVSGYLGNVALVWDATTGKHVLIYTGHSQGVEAVAWSPDGQSIASGGGDATVQVWNASTGKHIYTYTGHTRTVEGVAWSPDGKRIASASDDGTVQVRDAPAGTLVYTYRGHSGFVSRALWSPDGRRIASVGGDDTVQVWLAQ